MAKPRNTVQKTAVLAAVQGAKHHPDAKWIYGEVSRQLPDISLGTVYRALASLTAEGLIQKIQQVDGPSLYDSNTEEHDHIRCSQCGLIQDVPPVELPEGTFQAVRRASGFASVNQFRLEFIGMCSQCAQIPGESSNGRDSL